MNLIHIKPAYEVNMNRKSAFIWRIQNPAKHLRWKIFAKIVESFSQKAPS